MPCNADCICNRGDCGMIDNHPDPETTFDLLFPYALKEEIEMENARDELIQNGMFRNQDYDHRPLSGSDADCTFDADEIAYYEEILQKYPGVW